jgi:hypothetical protein
MPRVPAVLILDEQGWDQGLARTPSRLANLCSDCKILKVITIIVEHSAGKFTYNFCEDCGLNYIVHHWPHIDPQGKMSTRPIEIEWMKHPRWKR